jgi:predicted RNA-binding protein associated with RNAse of E/G family
MDGLHYRMLDLDEFADAVDAGLLTLEQGTDALRRWQRFIDRHLAADGRTSR